MSMIYCFFLTDTPICIASMSLILWYPDFMEGDALVQACFAIGFMHVGLYAASFSEMLKSIRGIRAMKSMYELLKVDSMFELKKESSRDELERKESIRRKLERKRKSEDNEDIENLTT